MVIQVLLQEKNFSISGDLEQRVYQLEFQAFLIYFNQTKVQILLLHTRRRPSQKTLLLVHTGLRFSQPMKIQQNPLS